MTYLEPDQALNLGSNPDFLAIFDTESAPSALPPAAGKKASPDALGIDAKYVGRFKARNTRKLLYQLQKRAAWLLPEERVSHCRWTMQKTDEPVQVFKHSDGRSSFSGLQTCGSVWACPICSQRISETRRQEMNQCLSWARGEGHHIFMMTLTARHSLGDDLSEQLADMKKALRRMRQRRDWKAMKSAALVGSVTATEVTHGQHGWHVHFHIILICNEDIQSRLKSLQNAWLSSLAAEGLEGVGKYAFKVDRGDTAGEYVAKFGAAEEITLGQQKKGRNEGRTPFQLLHDFTFDKDVRAGQMFKEFAETFKGTRQLIWSDGLRQLCGADDISDEEAAAEGEPEELIALIDRSTWVGVDRRGARNRRVKILDAAEVDASLCRRVIASDEIDDDPADENVSVIDTYDDTVETIHWNEAEHHEIQFGTSCKRGERIEINDTQSHKKREDERTSEWQSLRDRAVRAIPSVPPDRFRNDPKERWGTGQRNGERCRNSYVT